MAITIEILRTAAYSGSRESTYYSERERERLTAFCPSTAHRIPSDAFARTARIMYVGSIYFTSTGTPISLKDFFI